MIAGVCPTCGATNKSDGGFCASCGTYLDWATAPDAAPTPGVAVHPRRPAPTPDRPATPDRPSRPATPVTRRPLADERGRRSGLLAHQPLTAGTQGIPPSRGGLRSAGSSESVGGQETTGPHLGAFIGGGMCHRCGRSNPAGRRYCRCGTRLQGFEEPPLPTPSTAASDGTGPHTFRAAMRAAGGGRRPRFDKPLGRRTRSFRSIAVAGVLLLALVPLTPPGAGAIDRLGGSVMSLVPYGYDEVPVSGASVDPAQAAVPHYPPDYAVDQTGPRAWAVAWTGPALPAECGTSAAPALVIGFAERRAVSRIIVDAGPDPSDTTRTKQLAPKTIDILFSDGHCDRLDLADGAAGQEFRVSTDPVGQARVQIVAVTVPKGQTVGAAGQAPSLTSLSEIRFYSG